MAGFSSDGILAEKLEIFYKGFLETFDTHVIEPLRDAMNEVADRCTPIRLGPTSCVIANRDDFSCGMVHCRLLQWTSLPPEAMPLGLPSLLLILMQSPLLSNRLLGNVLIERLSECAVGLSNVPALNAELIELLSKYPSHIFGSR